MDYNELRQKYKDFTMYSKVYHEDQGACLITGILPLNFPILLCNNGKRVDSDLWLCISPDKGYTGSYFICPVEDVVLVERYEYNPFKVIPKKK